jgi:GTP-binding protein HflX
LVGALDAELVICDDDLTPAQGRNLEKRLERTIIDRTELIIAIFDQNARTRQAKAQVELARLEYSLPRLKRLWSHLDRERGGIGGRGAGEKQIQLDRRIIRRAIHGLKREIQQINDRKLREISTRSREFTVSLVGYTNTGKSTLMNRLTASDVLAENRLFSTLDTRTRTWPLGGGRSVLLSDTVGFIRGLPHDLVASFHATLEETIHADLLLHVVDASHPRALEQIAAAEDVLAEIGVADRAAILVLNKIDMMDSQIALAPLRNHDAEAVSVSARTGAGIDELVRRVRLLADEGLDGAWVALPLADPKLLAQVRRSLSVLDQRYDDNRVFLRVRVRQHVLDELLAKGGTLINAAEVPEADQA